MCIRDRVWTNNVDKDFETLCGPIPTAGFNDVTFTATDDCGRSIQTTATFNITDFTPPAFGFIPSDVTISCEDPLPTETVIFADICGIALEEFQETITSGNCPHESEITRNWTITDECGNQSFATQVITVIDNTAPTFDFVPASISISCDEPEPIEVPTYFCLLYTSPSPRDRQKSRMPSSA